MLHVAVKCGAAGLLSERQHRRKRFKRRPSHGLGLLQRAVRRRTEEKEKSKILGSVFLVVVETHAPGSGGVRKRESVSRDSKSLENDRGECVRTIP